MTKTELITKITDAGWVVLQEKEVGAEGHLTHWAVAASKAEGDIIIRKWFHFYVDDSGNAFWQNKDPLRDTTAPPNFSDELDDYIESAIGAGTIMGAQVMWVDNRNETAVVTAYMDDAGTKEKKLFVNKDGSGNIQYNQIA